MECGGNTVKDRRKIILLAVGLLLLAALLASCGTGDTAPDPLAVYKNQPLEWHACDSGWLESPFDAWAEQLGSRVGCTTMRVPLDYSRPEKGEITVALLRVRGEQPDRRLGVMAFNPGGPGGDGLSLAVISVRCGAKQIPRTPRQRFTRSCRNIMTSSVFPHGGPVPAPGSGAPPTSR